MKSCVISYDELKKVEAAAIANEDSHLISLLLMAKAQDKEIEVHLDSQSSGKYYSNRCLVTYLEIS